MRLLGKALRVTVPSHLDQGHIPPTTLSWLRSCVGAGKSCFNVNAQVTSELAIVIKFPLSDGEASLIHGSS